MQKERKKKKRPCLILVHMSTPSILLRAFFAILNFLANALLDLTTCSLTKNSIPFRRVSNSGSIATLVNEFHMTLSGYSNKASNNIRKCMILFEVSCPASLNSTLFKTESERVKEAIISATNFARCMDLNSGMDSSSLNWSQRQYCANTH